MVLSNAERQARFQKRLREKVARCITPELMLKAIKISHERIRAVEPDLPAWEEYMDSMQTARGRSNWFSDLDNAVWVPEDEEVGEEADLLRNARAVLDTILKPWGM